MAEKLTVGIDGMSCGHCKKTLEGGISKLNGIQSVNVDLEKKHAQIEFEGDAGEVVSAVNATIEDLGYDVRAA